MAQNVTGYPMIPQPLLFLLREPAVHEDLKLTESQIEKLTTFNESMDGKLLASRNKAPAEAQKINEAVLKQTLASIPELLNATQLIRIQQITYRLRGISFVIMPEAAKALELTEQQRSEIESLVRETRDKVNSLTTATYQGPEAHEKSQREILAARRAEQDGIVSLLTDTQRRKFGQLVGASFDTSRLGRVAFRAPELADGDIWINSKSLKLKDLRGKVVAIHFWAFGCSNCHQNYPWYQDWAAEFKDDDFLIIGVHTPETGPEREVSSVRKRTKQAGFEFPIVVDNQKSNWNTWGNSMWPAVYLIDKEGRIRYWWYGELNWKGAGGQKIMGQKIKELLLEESA